LSASTNLPMVGCNPNNTVPVELLLCGIAVPCGAACSCCVHRHCCHPPTDPAAGSMPKGAALWLEHLRVHCLFVRLVRASGRARARQQMIWRQPRPQMARKTCVTFNRRQMTTFFLDSAGTTAEKTAQIVSQPTLTPAACLTYYPTPHLWLRYDSSVACQTARLMSKGYFLRYFLVVVFCFSQSQCLTAMVHQWQQSNAIGP
jgi:hypothetical protein